MVVAVTREGLDGAGFRREVSRDNLGEMRATI
jgi:hypothetical protein